MSTLLDAFDTNTLSLGTGDAHMSRYFRCYAIDGALHVCGLNYGEEWNPERLSYWTTAGIDAFKWTAASERKIHSPDELEAVLRENVPGQLTLWLAEGLEEEARRRVHG